MMQNPKNQSAVGGTNNKQISNYNHRKFCFFLEIGIWRLTIVCFLLFEISLKKILLTQHDLLK